ncbi:MAG TPA: M48 family metallopeptidase [Rhizomicrobium sp.]|nr:M48 family metallopeptidase [Rhizomicrobium sp.]
MTNTLFPLIVGLAIAGSLAFEIWLDLRQIRWIGRHRGAVPTAFAGRIELAQHQRAIDYTLEKLWLSIIDTVTGTAVTILLLLGGLFAAIVEIATQFVGEGYLAGLLLVGAITVLYGAVGLPFAVWRVFHIEEKYGFNRSTVALFVADLVKGTLVAAALGTPFVLAADYLMRHAGPYWWLAVWALYVAFNIAVLLILPTFVMPLFNKFEPLDDASLKGRIETLLARCGFRSSGLFKMDGSKRSGHGNAFFTGLGPSKRIVLFDTIIASLSAPEIEAVLAHELGHFKLKHILKRMVVQFFLSLAFFALLGWLARQDWFASGLGIAPETAAAMPLVTLILFVMVLPAFTGWFKGFANWRSRVHEFEADAYAAVQTSGADLASALLKLHKDNASPSTTDPIYSTFRHSHPPTAERIARLQPAA